MFSVDLRWLNCVNHNALFILYLCHISLCKAFSTICLISLGIFILFKCRIETHCFCIHHITRRTTTFLKPKNVTCAISHSIIIEDYVILMATWHFYVYHMNHNLFNQSYPVAVCLDLFCFQCFTTIHSCSAELKHLC